MAVKQVKDRGASVLARLKKQAKESGINYQTCLQLFVQEEFLRRLELSSYAENFVLKGGMFLYVISNYEGRPTMDIDFMVRRLPSDVERMRNVIFEVCQVDTQNEFLRTLWRNYNPGLGLAKPEFSSVLKQIDRFFGPIFEAIKNEDEFFGMWSPEENVWK